MNQFQSIQSGFAELKNFYQGPIVSQFNDDLPIYRGAEKGKEKWSGYQVVRPLKVRRNQGIGATSDGGNLPAIGRQTTVQALIPAKFNYLRFGVTGPMIKASASDVGSFVRSASYELEEGYNDLKWDFNRQLSWNGDGSLAKMNAAVVGSNVIVLKGREDTEPALKFIDVGMVIDIVTSAGAYKAQNVEVSSISSGGPNSATATLVLNAAVTAAADDIIIRAGSLNNEVQGLLYALDGLTTTIYGVDRATYISYQGNVTNLAGAQLTLNALQGAWNQGLQRGAAKYRAMYSDFNSQQMYQKLLTVDKRYVNTVKGDGGFAAKDENHLEWNGLPWVADQSAPTRIFFLPDGAIKKYVLAELEFADETGSMMIAQTGIDEFEVRLRLFANLFNEKPAACSVIRNYISP